MPCLLVFLGAVIYLPWLSTWKYSTAVGAKCRDPLWRRLVGAASGDIQLQTLRKSEGFPVGDLVLRWLSWDTTSLHHPLTTLMALCPGQILPAVVESWLMGCAGLGEWARQVVPNCFKKQHLPRLTRFTVVWRQQETWAGKQLASSNRGSVVEQASRGSKCPYTCCPTENGKGCWQGRRSLW